MAFKSSFTVNEVVVFQLVINIYLHSVIFHWLLVDRIGHMYISLLKKKKKKLKCRIFMFIYFVNFLLHYLCIVKRNSRVKNIIFREEFDTNFLNDGGTETNIKLKPALDVYKIIFKFLYIYKKEKVQERIEKLCRYVCE